MQKDVNAPRDLKILIGRERIREKVSELAVLIRDEYRGRNPLLICVLKGGFVFTADLVRELDIPLEIDFIRVSSYGRGTESSGTIEALHLPKGPIKGRHVIVIEDIVDTGLSLRYVLDFLTQQKPASIRVCALMDKPSARRVPINIDYCGFTIPNKFVVGYGIDFDEQYRCLPDICSLEEKENGY